LGALCIEKQEVIIKENKEINAYFIGQFFLKRFKHRADYLSTMILHYC